MTFSPSTEQVVNKDVDSPSEPKSENEKKKENSATKENVDPKRSSS